eukprot:TRINITY_DN103_c0_g1_i6.p1 TRINITY_DN103_c0_g1~~TRINITY_DN103_c0_g1_i6.p1  ORF type:complete len:297 (-),score=88.45 TRINITY_DN103_c0_g1_i6:412-1302(-)
MGLKRILVALGLAAHLCTAQETWACRSFSISGASNVVLNESPACSNNWYITVLNGASVTVTSTVPVNLMRLRLQVNSGSQITFGGAPVQFTSASFGSGSGGSIYNAGDVTFNNDVSFLGNHAEDGGGIYNTPSGDMSFKGSAAFQGNSAVYGGAIFNNGGSMAFASAASFTDNSAVSGGGAIHNVNGDIAFAAEPTFDGNSAAINDDVDSNNGGVTGLPAGAGGGMSSTEIGWITALCVGAAALLCCACTWFAMRRRRRKPSPPQQAQLLLLLLRRLCVKTRICWVVSCLRGRGGS